MIFLIAALALFLRLINLNQSFWLDEAINVNNVANLSFKNLIFDYSLSDFHPPLYHVILRANTLLIGTSEIAARLPSVVFGVLTVYITYLIARKLYEEKTALIAAILLATAPLHIYYSQEARMYSLAAFLASLSVYFFISILKKEKVLAWCGFITSTALMLYSDYLVYLLIPTYICYLAIFRKNIKKSTLLGFLPAFVLISLILVPWLLIFPKQLAVGLSAANLSPAWANVVGSSELKFFAITFVKFTIGRISSDNNLVYSIVFLPAGIFVFLMFLISFFRMSIFRSFALFWFFTPLILGFVISFFVPIFAYIRYIFVLPAFYLIWASAINTINVNKYVKMFLLSGLLINVLTLSIYYLNPKFQRENWRGAVSYVRNQAKENSIVLFESNHTVAPFDYYNMGYVKASGALDSFSAKRENVSSNLENLTQYKDQVFLFQYLSGITDPNGILFEEIINKGFTNTSTKDFAGVGFVYEFNR